MSCVITCVSRICPRVMGLPKTVSTKWRLFSSYILHDSGNIFLRSENEAGIKQKRRTKRPGDQIRYHSMKGGNKTKFYHKSTPRKGKTTYRTSGYKFRTKLHGPDCKEQKRTGLRKALHVASSNSLGSRSDFGSTNTSGIQTTMHQDKLPKKVGDVCISWDREGVAWRTMIIY